MKAGKEYGKPSMGCFMLPSVGSQVISFTACLTEAVQPSAVQYGRALQQSMEVPSPVLGQVCEVRAVT